MSNSNEYWNPEDPRYYQSNNAVNQTFDGTNFILTEADSRPNTYLDQLLALSRQDTTVQSQGLAPPPWTAFQQTYARELSADGWATSGDSHIDLDEEEEAKKEERRLKHNASAAKARQKKREEDERILQELDEVTAQRDQLRERVEELEKRFGLPSSLPPATQSGMPHPSTTDQSVPVRSNKDRPSRHQNPSAQNHSNVSTSLNAGYPP
ncbi:uncharacterized protein L203_105245 [Cryptococcus depauperatus CBS 7841]|uniref:BZIP domain-containing protein n=1 Tax=Cryptococcus depauperatus CBS 7841 TaxID=1295531 RepID=A0AAJ8M396_9TREE